MRLGYHIAFFHAHFEFFSRVFLENAKEKQKFRLIFFLLSVIAELLWMFTLLLLCVCVLFFFKAESSGIVYCVLSLFGAIGPNSPFTVAVTQNNSTEITAVSLT